MTAAAYHPYNPTGSVNYEFEKLVPFRPKYVNINSEEIGP